MFRNFNGKYLDLEEYIANYLANNNCDTIYIGCDSKNRKFRTNYVTAICFHSLRGVHVIYEKEIVEHDKKPDMRSRIWNEVEYSKQAADRVTEILIANYLNVDMYIHIDISNNKINQSHELMNASIGFINSFGYECEAKPGAWAASFAADRFTD